MRTIALMAKYKIGLTFSETRWEFYPKWVKGNDEEIEIVELHWSKHNLDEVWDMVEDCDGIVMTGGVDIHPRFYGSERLEFPNADGVYNEVRDEFEMHVFETALNFKKPILAICRGMQLVNTALGGDVIQDLEEAGKKNHRRRNNVDDEHEISITKDSLLHQVVGVEVGNVNGAHHQAVGRLSEELIATATSADGVIEAIEWKDKSDEPWMLCVQWHPERMQADEVCSKNVRESFLKEVKK